VSVLDRLGTLFQRGRESSLTNFSPVATESAVISDGFRVIVRWLLKGRECFVRVEGDLGRRKSDFRLGAGDFARVETDFRRVAGNF
jgi:hypothetical protein